MATLPVPLHAWSTHQTVIGLPAPADKRTSLPVSNSTKSFWFTDADVRPVPHEGSEGPVTDGADICIIGSGITGVSAAYHLSRAFSGDNSLAASLGRPVKAVLFEAREFCSGATGTNGGHLTAHKFGEFRRWQKELGQEEAMRALEIEQYTVKELTRILKENGKEEYVDLTHGGRLMLMFSEQELTETKADYEAAKSAGADMTGVEWLSKEEVWRRYGAPYPAVLIPGNNLWPLKAVSVLYNLAQNSSANFSLNLHTRTPVTSISPIEASNAVANSPFPRRHTLTTPRGPVTCSYVLHATNAYASHLLPHLAGPNGIVPTRGQIIAVRASVPAKELSDVGGTGNEGFEYWFPRPVKSDAEETPLVIVGGGREVAKGFELYETDDSVINKDVGVALRAFLPATFPEKYDAEQDPEMEWTGIMGYTHSGDPFVGPVVDKGQRGDNPAYDGQFIAAGYAGHGMPRAFACAEAVVGMIVADIQGKMWSPPSWLPRGYLTQHKDASQTG
ncbi:FAD dependent oxidoreductase [Cristinia sonorae]|uniref:FAD dependent oxidoreductase n=1 Tax=Cristinia sonorae TaxID=1940300 RepID=A0A8K0XKE2_9AGAR|nr:FAD dependent oxidoreductase [Cristinia sonorae]